MMRSAAQYMGFERKNTTMVGDTVETDIIGATFVGFKSILVLSGMADKNSYKNYAYKPMLVVNSVNDIELP